MQTQMQPASTTAVGLRYGILLAVSSVLIDFLTRIAGFSFMTFGIVAGLGTVVVGTVWLVVAHKAFKRGNGGLMSFGQGVLIAIIMLLISGSVSGLFNYVYLHYIDAEFVARMKTGMVEFMERNNVPDDQIELSAAKVDEMKKGLVASLFSGLSGGLALGLVLGLIVSLFTKRSQPEFE